MNWGKIAAIAKKDLGHYFVSPMGYVVLAIFFGISGFFFWLIVGGQRQAYMSPVFQNTLILLLFITPLITMRLWSEEEKSGTAELLRTSPLTTWEIVLGKYLAVCCFFGVMLSGTFVYLAIMMAVGKPDLGPVAANYLGYLLVGMTFFALGLLSSTLSENQIVSAVICYGILLMLWVLGAAVGENVQGPLGEFIKGLSMYGHVNDFMMGIIDLTHLAYFLSLIFVGLFLSVKVLDSKRN